MRYEPHNIKLTILDLVSFFFFRKKENKEVIFKWEGEEKQKVYFITLIL